MPDWRSALEKVHPRYRATAALFGAWLLFFGPVIFTSDVLFARDLLFTEIPLRDHLRTALAHGHLARWFPNEMFGVPFMGTVIASAFHPRTLLFLFMDTVDSTKWSLLLAYLVALVGGYRLARTFGASRLGSVAGAYAFALSGCAVSYGNKTNMLMGLVCAPWMLAAVWRMTKRDDLMDVVSLGVWWALVFLGGDPQLFIECAVVGGGLLLAGGITPNKLARFIVGGVLAVAVAGVELVPSLGLGDDSIRAYWQKTRTLEHMWALNPLRLFEMVIPHFLPEPIRIPMGNFLETRADFFIEWIFVGGAATALALFGVARKRPGRLVWALTAVVGLWLAMGWFFGLGSFSFMDLWWKVIPFLAKFRYPEKYIGIVMVAYAPLVAWGVDSVVTKPLKADRIFFIAAAALLAIAWMVPGATLTQLAMSFAKTQKQPDPELLLKLAAAWKAGLFQTAIILAALGGAIRMLPQDELWKAAIPAVVFAEIWLGNHDLLRTVTHKRAVSIGKLAQALQAEHKPNEPTPRVLPAAIKPTDENLPAEEEVGLDHLALQSDDAARAGIDTIEVNAPGELWRVVRTFYGKKQVNWDTWMPRFNVCYRVATSAEPPKIDEEVISPAYERGMELVRRPCLGRAYLARAESVPDAEAAQQRMRDGLLDDLVVWEGGPAIKDYGGMLKWEAAEPEYLKLTVDAQKESALVVSDSYAAGWTATIDGKATQIYPTDAAARGIVVPQGSHTVEMTYTAPGEKAGTLLSILGVLGCFGLVALRRRRLEELELWKFVASQPPRIWSCVALVVGWLAFFGTIAFSSKVLWDRDLILTELPLRQYMAEALRAGRIPQWFPYEVLGLPFSGSLVATPFHPQALLHLFLSPAQATKWRIILAFAFALAGGYRLARQFGNTRVASVTGAYALAFSGFIISMNNDNPYLMPMAAAPWMVAAAWRMTKRNDLRDIASLGFWWAMVFLGGDAQLFLECGLIAGGLFLAAGIFHPKSRAAPIDSTGPLLPSVGETAAREGFRFDLLARFGLGMVLTTLIACPELLPGLAMRHDFERETWKQTTQLAKTWAVPWFRYPDFLIPHFVPDHWREPMGTLVNPRLDFFGFSLFVGSTVLVLAIAGMLRNSRVSFVWMITLGFTFYLSTGSYGGMLEWWWKIAPGFDKFRYPEKFNSVVGLAIGMLTALGVTLLQQGGLARSRKLLAQITIGAGALAFAIGALVPQDSLFTWWMKFCKVANDKDRTIERLMVPEMSKAIAEAWSQGMVQTGLFLISLGLVIWFLNREKRLLYVLPALVLVELWNGNAGRMPVLAESVVSDLGRVGQGLKDLEEPNQPPPRVYPATPNSGMDLLPNEDRVHMMHLFLYSNEASRGNFAPFDVNSPAESWRVMRTFFGRRSSVTGDWVSQFGICYRVATDANPQQPGEEPIAGAEDTGFQLLRRPSCLPRAFLASAESVKGVDLPDHRESFEAAQKVMKPPVPPAPPPPATSDEVPPPPPEAPPPPPMDHVVWENGPTVTGYGGTVTWRRADPEYLSIDVDATQDSALVISDAYANGWSATIDKEPTKIYATSGCIRGVFVPKGKHTVRMKYLAPGLTAGLAAGAFGWLGSGALIFAGLRMRKRKSVTA